ncbi:hypothetical protein AMTR_s00002p00270290 [Amborella trichopoda]|uniref:Uncharacterized protein n=1 Tax=Amborella trichopoda TaxID=13333 RepID=W1P3G0_AMBTC|nr:hypothetical protein AMTR_s00002p00270290 [Amborella trichopoda]
MGTNSYVNSVESWGSISMLTRFLPQLVGIMGIDFHVDSIPMSTRWNHVESTWVRVLYQLGGIMGIDSRVDSILMSTRWNHETDFYVAGRIMGTNFRVDSSMSFTTRLFFNPSLKPCRNFFKKTNR